MRSESKGSTFSAPLRNQNARLIVFNSRISCFPIFFCSGQLRAFVVDPKCDTACSVWKICSGNSIDSLCAFWGIERMKKLVLSGFG